MTKEQWDEIGHKLTLSWGQVFLECDGYLVLASVVQHKMRLQIEVFVNGYMKGVDIFVGNESELPKMTDTARRFYCLSKRSFKIFKTKKPLFIYSAIPTFRTPNAFIKHIKKHNQVISVLDTIPIKRSVHNRRLLMADELDRAEQAIETMLAVQIANARQPSESVLATGFCLFCESPISELGRRWCNADCRDDWERER